MLHRIVPVRQPQVDTQNSPSITPHVLVEEAVLQWKRMRSQEKSVSKRGLKEFKEYRPVVYPAFPVYVLTAA